MIFFIIFHIRIFYFSYILFGGGRLRAAMEGRKMALRAAAAVEEVGGLRAAEEEELELGSSTARRSQRHEGQKPVKFSCGWRSQEVEGRWGWRSCGGGGGNGGGGNDGGGWVVGFMNESKR